MNIVEAKIEIAPKNAEPVNDILLELGQERWSLFEDIIAGRAWIVGVFQSRPEAQRHAEELLRLLPPAAVVAGRGPVLRELPEAEWRDSYKAHFHAWQFGRLHWVPVWEKSTFVLPEGDAVVWLDPGLAFGTGNHESTRLCVERLVEFAAQNGTTGRVIDAGCGSGILALSAAKLGFGDVSGFDNDPEAVRVSEENAVMNEMSGQVRFFAGELTDGLKGREAELVLANILADVLIRHARELTDAVASGGTLILSGILTDECEQVRRAYAEVVPDWAQQSRALGEWSGLVLTRPSRAHRS